MSSEILKKFAGELKSLREEKQISLQHLYNKTRIDKKYLEAIENGNFSIMPEVYIRAFIKEYAAALDLDKEETLHKYDLALEGKLYEPKHEEKPLTAPTASNEQGAVPKTNFEFNPKPIQNSPENFNETHKKPNVLYLIGGILLVVIVYLLYNNYLSNSTQEVITERPFKEVVKSSDEKYVEPAKTENLQPALKAIADSLKLKIVGTDTSWVRIVADDKVTSEFIIIPKLEKNFTGNQKFYLHIGNSGGVDLYLNDKLLQFSGSKGRVRKINVTKNGIEYLRIESLP